VSEFMWIAVGMFGSCLVGFAAGFFAARYERPLPRLPHLSLVEEPPSHVFPVRYDYNGQSLIGTGLSAPPEFYDWELHGEA
jgi:hypothetical protein